MAVKVRETWLQMQRHRIVNLRPDARLLQVLPQRIAPLRAEHVLVVDVPRAGTCRRRAHGGAEVRTPEALLVEGGVLRARGAPAIQVRQLHVEHRGLQLIDTEVAADERVVVLRFPAVHAQHGEPLGERRIVGDTRAGIAEGAEVLGREEGQAADIAETAGARAVRVRRADRLGGILDHLQGMGPGEWQQRLHVGQLAIEVHRHQRAHARVAGAVHQIRPAPLALLLEERAQRLRRDIERLRIDVAEDRPRARAGDGAGGGEEREGTGDHRIARTDVERHEREQQCIGARGDADAVTALAVAGERGLERLDLGSQDEVLARAHPLERRAHLRGERGVLRFQIKQRHPHGGAFRSCAHGGS